MCTSAPSSTPSATAGRYHHHGTDNRSSNAGAPDVADGVARVVILHDTPRVTSPPWQAPSMLPRTTPLTAEGRAVGRRRGSTSPDPGGRCRTRARVRPPGDAGVDLSRHRGRRARPRRAGAWSAPASRSRCRTGYAGFVHPRSGLAARAGLSVVNAPGTVDAGYRGEIRVCLINHDPRAELSAAPRRPDRPAGGAAGRARRGSSRSAALPESVARRGWLRLHRRARAARGGVRDGAPRTRLASSPAKAATGGRDPRPTDRSRRRANPADEPGARTIGALAVERGGARPGPRRRGDDIGDARHAGPSTRRPRRRARRADRVDFGALRVPLPRGGAVWSSPRTGRLQAVHVMLPAGRLSVSALAAPHVDPPVAGPGQGDRRVAARGRRAGCARSPGTGAASCTPRTGAAASRLRRRRRAALDALRRGHRADRHRWSSWTRSCAGCCAARW